MAVTRLQPSKTAVTGNRGGEQFLIKSHHLETVPSVHG